MRRSITWAAGLALCLMGAQAGAAGNDAKEAPSGQTQRERVRNVDERVSALLRAWKEAGGGKPAADRNEIRRLITQLGAPTADQRTAAQKALVRIGLPVVEALTAATEDANPERAARARDALAQMVIRKEDWPVSWRGLTFSWRIISSNASQCQAVCIDADRRAIFIQWDLGEKAFAKTEWTVPQGELDMLHTILGKRCPWEQAGSASAAAAWFR